MTTEQIKNSISYCGLICCLCHDGGDCNCKTSNNCAKAREDEGCYQYNCCRERGYNGCWECPDFCCGKDLFNQEHLRLKTFVKCIKEDGIDKFAEYILRNYNNGIEYHTSGYIGDYDLETEEEILFLLRNGAEKMSNDLLSNLDKLHTTELGFLRIRKNLCLDVPNVVEWCKQKVLTADDIVRKGKNWYVSVDGCIITINAHSYTIITAHKEKNRNEPDYAWHLPPLQRQ